jgi:apolipoprotein D and lipocalin family protein
MPKKLTIFMLLFLAGCVGIPKNISPVTDFEVDRYLGTWYEIVRLDHSFERGLEKVTASYSYRDDGCIKVINRGFDPEKTGGKRRLESHEFNLFSQSYSGEVTECSTLRIRRSRLE